MDPDARDESSNERGEGDPGETIPYSDAGSGESSSGSLRPAAAGARPESIGPYRIIDVLGEGGMGIVYLAEQVEPVRRRVALKVIKLGMDTREVVARFEAERQALALLDHPGIARIYDGGATEDGRPYFVMERVQGVPLVEYCDRHRLSLKERLGLFAQVCRAVDHAHHRGIIHRDLKPSNILVSTPDREPVAKIIDFGVGKATNQRLTEKTIYTEVGRVIGTPAYMSPEQAEMTSEDVDHRSDIYSLGVILYEILVGEVPLLLDAQRIAFDEIMRRIREEDPPKPSTRWTQLNLERTRELAARRATSPGALRGELRGDLDWMTMRAMEKERERRYQSAAYLADDIERFLRGEPVLAGPPGLLYQVKKYVRRHRAMVLATAAVILALAAGLVVSICFAVVARNSETRARAQLDEILRLSDMKDLETYRLEAEELWPAKPSMVERLEAWRAKARALAGRLPEHRLSLENLRKRALPYAEEEAKADRQSHPRRAELTALENEQKELEKELAKLEAEVPKDARVTVLSFGDDPKKKHPSHYFRSAFEIAAPEKLAALRFFLLADDGAVVYLNGKEVVRDNVAEGPVAYGTLAAKALDEKEQESFRTHEKRREDLGGALLAGRNVLAVEVHQASRRSGGLRFDLEVVGVPLEGEAVTLLPKGSSWRYSDRGEDVGDAWRAPAYDDSSWTAGAGPFGYGFSTGLGRLLELRVEKPKLADKIARLEKELAVRRTWSFADTRDRWWHDALTDLVRGLEAFTAPATGAIASVEKRLDFARTVRKRTIDDAKAKWDEAIASIKNREECPKYNGLVIAPQEGLIPIGRDPRSGLWEFAHLQTGEIPKRGPDGRLAITEATGIVFVLIPGGTFRMGAVRPDEKNAEGSPNVDPFAEKDEGPVHEVTLGPFFLSKYEMTQGQWLRFGGENPSHYGPDQSYGGKDHDVRHPVENVTWDDCRRLVGRLSVALPTEA